MLLDTEYLSHQPVLVAAFSDLRIGRVLELGCGFGSSPLLHALCASHDCSLVTLESCPAWLAQFEYLRRPWHRLDVAPDMAQVAEYGEQWDIAFVDHAQAEKRGLSVAALAHNAEIVIAHDSCYGHLYGYFEAFAQYKYQHEYTAVRPHTMALSNIAGRLDVLVGVLR